MRPCNADAVLARPNGPFRPPLPRGPKYPSAVGAVQPTPDKAKPLLPPPPECTTPLPPPGRGADLSHLTTFLLLPDQLPEPLPPRRAAAFLAKRWKLRSRFHAVALACTHAAGLQDVHITRDGRGRSACVVATEYEAALWARATGDHASGPGNVMCCAERYTIVESSWEFQRLGAQCRTREAVCQSEGAAPEGVWSP